MSRCFCRRWYRSLWPRTHLARLVLSLVKDNIDLAEISGSYEGDRGQPPFDPVMMTALLFYC